MNEELKTENKDQLLQLASEYAHEVYKLSKKLPRDEIFGITSQLRRAALSVPLNIVEGHARNSDKHRINFCRIAFGSLKESQFLINFCAEEKLMRQEEVDQIFRKGDRVAAMLWTKIKTLQSKTS